MSRFFYNGTMKIYLDLVLLLNFTFDFLLLMSVSLLLRRNNKFFKIILGSLIGSLSILFLFVKITSLQLFLLKIAISIVMVLITFGYRNIKYTIRNLGYLYMASIILGGFLYFLNLEFSYKHEGIIFFHNGLSINYIFLLIFSPIILYIYIKQGIKLKKTYTNYYKIKLNLNGRKLNWIGYLDTGNNLVDPIKKRPIILVNPGLIKEIPDYFLVPYQSSSNLSTLKCFKVNQIEIEKIGIKKNIVIGIMNKEICIDGVDCLLNNRLWEEEND